MNSKCLWMFLLILQCGIVTPRPTQTQRERDLLAPQQYSYDDLNKPKDESNNDDQVISVRITSSVAVGRNKQKTDTLENSQADAQQNNFLPSLSTAVEAATTEVPPNLVGANIEFIRQLNAKKEARNYQPIQSNTFANGTEFTPRQPSSNLEYDKLETNINLNTASSHTPKIQPEDSVAEPSIKKLLRLEEKHYNYEGIAIAEPASQTFSSIKVKIEGEGLVQSHTIDADAQDNVTEDSITASSIESILTVEMDGKSDVNVENVPLARSVPFSPSSKNYIQGLTNKLPSERGNSASLTTVSFNIVHETPNQPTNYNIPSNTYTHSDQGFSASNKFYEPPKVYSQPAKIYSEPAKIYSEPAKIYSEPAKIYSVPAKVYSEPAKVYSEPAKFYSQPASLHLTPDTLPKFTPWQDPSQRTDIASTNPNTTPAVVNTLPSELMNTQKALEMLMEKNYEVDEKVSVMTEGRSHGVQESTTEKCKQDNCKVGYVVEGRQYKKYRVEERTPDGFIVGEYGVVRNEDGALRGVRYTADSDASPRLIYDALMKFLQLK